MRNYMTTADVAEYLQVPIGTIYQWRTRATGPRAARIGRHLRWLQADVDEWVERQTSAR